MVDWVKSFLRNCRGAVTVFVTLLLIPAVLVSGTGVDLARIFSGRSLLQDANQLAANSVLANYDALLHDLYGLFAVSTSEEELNDMAKGYVKTALFSDGTAREGTNVLKLFYGAEPSVKVTAAANQNLAVSDMLRRQIEEYSKLRAPVVAADEIIDRVKQFQKTKADSEIIKEKVGVEKGIDQIDKIYQQMYDDIRKIDECPGVEQSITRELNDNPEEIPEILLDMSLARDTYTELFEDEIDSEPDEDGSGGEDGEESSSLMDNYAKYYDALAKNICALIDGGTYGMNWSNSNQKWETTKSVRGIRDIAEDGKRSLDEYIEALDKLKDDCEKADKKKAEIERKIAELKSNTQSSDCSQELKDGLLGKDGQPGLIAEYEKLIAHDFSAMAERVYDENKAHLDAYTDYLENIGSQPFFTYLNSDGILETLTLDEFEEYVKKGSGRYMDVDVDLTGNEYEGTIDYLGLFLGGSFEKMGMTGTAKKWVEFDGGSRGEYTTVYEELEKLCSDTSEAKKQKASITKTIRSILEAVQILFGEIIVDPEGAHKYAGGSSTDGGGSSFGSGSDWGKDGAAEENLTDALDSDIISQVGDLLGSMGDKLLLLVYSGEMFSNYTTESGEKTMSGSEMGLDVNYFFQSELEYIYNGNLNDAIANHNSVGSMLLLVRFVFNYIASFSIKSVNKIVNWIKTALAALPFVGVAVGELARLMFAVVESLMDLSRLRSGCSVSLFKNDKNWKFSVDELANLSKELVVNSFHQTEEDGKNGSESVKQKLSDENGLYYIDYLRIFLLFVNGDDMAERVGNLISLNLTNKTNDLGKIEDRTAREEKMASLERYDMSKAKTGFIITTEAEMSMMFLSMPFAQKGVNSVVPPKTMTVSAVDYRGY